MSLRPPERADVLEGPRIPEEPNALHAVSPDGASWSSINLAEAVPGVMTPLTASVWVPASELGLRAPFHAMGALETSRSSVPEDPAQRITNAFYGRMAVRVDFLCEIGDLIPGQSGEALARDFFGYVPPGYVNRPSLRRLPAILARYPRTLLGIASEIERLRGETDAWWRREISRASTLDRASAQRVVTDAASRFRTNLAAQATISACAIQPVQEQLDRLCSAAGIDPAVLLRGASHEEVVVLSDLWLVARGALTLSEFLLRHGYHGPGEGECETRVWREDPAPVERILEQYAARPHDHGPDANAVRHRAERAAAERTLLRAAGGPVGRARVVLRLARRFIPLRGVGKVSYLQSLDVLRAAARRLGALLVAEGRLTTVDDAFYLTAAELAGGLTEDLAALTADRRTTRERYRALEIPTAWTGQPVPVSATAVAERSGLSGVGACHGVAEGRAVVVLDPSTAEIDEGDILIAHTTDPAWVSLMFLCGGLVVDIGGMMSHAAVVARELGVPCVMNTGVGTRTIAAGDIVRVDGAAGTVEILRRACEIVPT